jgi:beta-lactamase class A
MVRLGAALGVTLALTGALPPGAGALEFSGEGRGIPEAPYPSAAAIAGARSYLEGRDGETAFAVLDSAGRLSGLNLREHFETASVIKVMFLTAYLQMLAAHHRDLTAGEEALLYPMIHESNNEDASTVLGAVGQPAILRVAHEAGMEDYVPGVGWWAYSQTSAEDQARFLRALPRLIPRRFYAYALRLMAGIEPLQSWGFPPVARPRWQVFFKTGALPEEGLFNEVARLQRPGVTFTVAVMTDRDPTMAYGEETIEGVAARLLGG